MNTSNPDKKPVIRCLQKILPTASVLYHEEDLRPYECDGLSAYQQVPMVVVLPETVKQIKDILAFCCDNKIPVVARGAGTGLSGGALPLENGILMSLAKFNRILGIDTE
ncbi:MAG: FAD-binding protein, partial [Gammaproteobacteria bacterium]